MDTAKVDAAQPTPPASRPDAKALLGKLQVRLHRLRSLTITGERPAGHECRRRAGKSWPRPCRPRCQPRSVAGKNRKDVGAEISSVRRPSQASGAERAQAPNPPNARSWTARGEGGSDKSISTQLPLRPPDQSPGVWRAAKPCPNARRATRGRRQRRRQRTKSWSGHGNRRGLHPLPRSARASGSYDAPTTSLSTSTSSNQGDGKSEICLGPKCQGSPLSFGVQ
jgi:hypothetical protein